MMKRICALALVLALACSAAMVGFAADSGSVEYDGKTLTVDGAMDGFNKMLPGIPAEDEIMLHNSSNSLTQFYMDTTVMQSLLEDAETSGYVVRMWVEDENANVLTTILGDEASNTGEQVGGADENNQNTGLKDLETVLDANGTSTQANGNDSYNPDNYLLVATLAKDGTAYVKMSITPDGSATGNEYMATNGEILFNFYVQEIDPITRTETKVVKGEDVVVTQTRYWLNGVQTGDPVAIAPLVVVLALAVLVFLIAAKKKKQKEE